MVKILIADDHPIVRQGLKQILLDESDATTVGEAQNSWEVLELAKKEPWDIVILDITMPGRGGLDVLKELRREYPKLPVLILSMHPEDQYAIRVLKAGASGYLTKSGAPEELVKAVRKILSGRKYVSEALAEKMAFHLGSGTEELPHEILSDREYEVLMLIASGKTVTEIAGEMSLSVKTVSTYRSRILGKMKMRTSAELTHYAIKNKLVE